MTGLLYLIVIVMWAAILVPIWLKNHDRSKVVKSIEKETTEPITWKIAPKRPVSRKKQAYIRRRNVLISLLASVVFTAILVILSVVPFVTLLLPVALLIAFTSAAAKVATASSRPVSRVQIPQPASEHEQSVDAASASITEVAQENARAWQPVESPVPSYVRIQRAGSSSSAADARRSWTAQDMLEQAAQLREARAAQMKESQRRLEEARAVALEKVRKAAIGNQGNADQESGPRAVNE